jgi:NADH-quinone oxidoreductase subunit G
VGSIIDALITDVRRSATGEPRLIDALVIAGVDVSDDPRASELLGALDDGPFLVALSTHHSDVTERADVVFPVAVVTEKAGAFTDWEGRIKPFSAAVRGTPHLPDGRVLAMLADVMDVPFGNGDVASLRAELDLLTPWTGPHPDAPTVAAPTAEAVGSTSARLGSWRLLLDRGRLQEGEPHLAATARATEALMSIGTAEALGVAGADVITVSTPSGAVTLPLRIADVVDGAIWTPMCSEGCDLLSIGAFHGATVRVTGGAS